MELENTSVKINQTTNYPWDGNVKLKISPTKESTFSVKVRIPGWLVSQPLPGDLYTYTNSVENKPVIRVNGEIVEYNVEKGYAELNRQWNTDDEIELTFPMDVKKVKAIDLVEDDHGKIALERGPIVYCVEEIDNPEIDALILSDHTNFSTAFNSELLAGVEVITASGNSKNEDFTAIPYYVWNNRGANKMNVWLTEK
jgi:hypothetical protein